MPNWTVLDILPSILPAPLEPERGGYTLTMRESAGAEAVLAQLVTEQAEDRRVHVGWGSFRNLDVSAARQSSWILLLDINQHQFRVWDGVRAAMADSACVDAESFVETVVPLLPHEPRLRQFSPSTRDWLLGDLERPGSWLFRERRDRFDWIRRLFLEGRVATGCIDLRAPPDRGTFAEMGRRIERASIGGDVRFDTLYVSNLPWMLAQREGFFGESNAQFAAGSDGVLAQVRENLERIVPYFRHIVAAGHLAGTSRDENLQWETRLLTPSAFLDRHYWRGLAPISGRFRSLR